MNKDCACDLRRTYFEIWAICRKVELGKKFTQGYDDRRESVVESTYKQRSNSITFISEKQKFHYKFNELSKQKNELMKQL